MFMLLMASDAGCICICGRALLISSSSHFQRRIRTTRTARIVKTSVNPITYMTVGEIWGVSDAAASGDGQGDCPSTSVPSLHTLTDDGTGTTV